MMITLYCSNKLQTFIGFNKSETDSVENSDIEAWNAHIFKIDRKNCLFFINHKTCFSFIVFNIKKPEMKNLTEILKRGFIAELKKCDLINDDQTELLNSKISDLFFHSSINNRKIIGIMNNFIMIVKDMKYFTDEKITTEDYYKTNTLNDYPIASLKYGTSIEAMKDEIHFYLK